MTLTSISANNENSSGKKGVYLWNIRITKGIQKWSAGKWCEEIYWRFVRATKHCCYSRIWIIFLGVLSNTALDRMWRTSWLHNLLLVLICIFSQNYILKIFRDICKIMHKIKDFGVKQLFLAFLQQNCIACLFGASTLVHLFTCLWNQKNPQKAKKNPHQPLTSWP